MSGSIDPLTLGGAWLSGFSPLPPSIEVLWSSDLSWCLLNPPGGPAAERADFFPMFALGPRVGGWFEHHLLHVHKASFLEKSFILGEKRDWPMVYLCRFTDLPSPVGHEAVFRECPVVGARARIEFLQLEIATRLAVSKDTSCQC